MKLHRYRRLSGSDHSELVEGDGHHLTDVMKETSLHERICLCRVHLAVVDPCSALREGVLAYLTHVCSCHVHDYTEKS